MQFFDTNIHTITLQIPYIHNDQFLYDNLKLPITPANDTSQFHVIDIYQNNAIFCPEIYLSFHKMLEIKQSIKCSCEEKIMPLCYPLVWKLAKFIECYFMKIFL